MFTEIVIPNENENEFIKIASKLEIKKITFLYNLNDDYNAIVDKINSLDTKDMVVDFGFLTKGQNILKDPSRKLIVAQSSDKDRSIIENKSADVIFGLEESQKKDHLHQRASGLNHILCEIASKNKISIGFSYCMIQKSSNQHQLIGRMMQNIKLCKKYGTNILIASFAKNPMDLRSSHDVISLFKLFGL